MFGYRKVTLEGPQPAVRGHGSSFEPYKACVCALGGVDRS